jgi:pSer/pThr/pTyr-binding forkhead associated (FHA) protein
VFYFLEENRVVKEMETQLLVERGPLAGSKFALPQLPAVIGRGATAEICLGDPHISRRHACISRSDDGGLVVEDLGSANGVFINDVRITAPRPLRPGDRVSLGPNVCFRLEKTTAAPAAPPPPRLTIALANGTKISHDLTADEINLGRSVDNDIVVPSLVVSRKHLRLVRRENDYLAQTLPTAANPCLLAGLPLLGEQPLWHDDELVIGPDVLEHTVILRYESATAVKPDPTLESDDKLAADSPIAHLQKEDLDKIIGQKNLLLRNLQITQGYHEVAQMLGQFLGFDNVNWFGFGTYASKTAGRAIRHETLPRPLKSALIRSAGYQNTQIYLDRALVNAAEQSSLVDNRVAATLERVSLLLSEGNLLIFSELAWPFVDMVNEFGQTPRPDPARFNPFLDRHFIPGPFEQGGQDWLRESLTSFYHARFTADKKRKTELIFLGNILLALHEQSRLQPVIERALAVPFDEMTRGIIPETNKELGMLHRRLANLAINFSREMVLRSVTRMAMTYTLPHREMKLGQNVVAPTGLITFPIDLLILANPRCLEIIGRFDIGLETLSGSGADNWGSLDDRMRFIIPFFRSYQREMRLLSPPFADSQTAAIKAGHFPGGKL